MTIVAKDAVEVNNWLRGFLLLFFFFFSLENNGHNKLFILVSLLYQYLATKEINVCVYVSYYIRVLEGLRKKTILAFNKVYIN